MPQAELYCSMQVSNETSIHLSIYPSIHLPIYPSIHLSIYPSIHLSIYPSTHLPIHVYIPRLRMRGTLHLCDCKPVYLGNRKLKWIYKYILIYIQCTNKFGSINLIWLRLDTKKCFRVHLHLHRVITLITKTNIIAVPGNDGRIETNIRICYPESRDYNFSKFKLVNICSCGELGSSWKRCVPPSTEDEIMHNANQVASIVLHNEMLK